MVWSTPGLCAAQGCAGMFGVNDELAQLSGTFLKTVLLYAS